MKKINHWINGKNVAGADYFHTTNPATGESTGGSRLRRRSRNQPGGSGGERGLPEVG